MFMVALEENAVVPRGMFDQTVDRLTRPISSIDVVAEKYIENFCGLMIRGIGLDEKEHLIEQIETAVNVPDRIETKSRRK